MQGYYYLSVLFLTSHTLTMGLSDSVIEENNQNSAAIDLNESYSEHRRKLPIFPKNTIKFVVTSKPHTNTVDNNKDNRIMTKLPIMTHLILKPITETKSTTQLTSRKPLMKLRTFTMETHSNGNNNRLEKNARHDLKKVDTPTIRTGILKTDPVTLIPEDTITKFYLTEENRNNFKKIPFLLKNDEQNKKVQKSEESGSNKISADNYSSEEEEDRNEFIFKENKDEKQEVNNILDISGQNFDSTFETTTKFNFILMEKEMRVKRSKNVIEEENMASTVSGFKYTGRETRLNNDLYFKNINS